MLDRIIQLALTHRLVVIALAALVLVYGAFVATRLPVDVFPDLNRPTITILTESGGLSPEEVEALVTTPIERSVNGSGQVVRVRSTSAVGLSVVWVELAWDADLVRERQLVVERLQLAKEQLPAGINPVLAPIASIMGEIMLLAVQSDDERTSPLELRSLADWVIRPRLLTQSGVAQVTVMGGGEKQFQVEVDPAKLLAHGVTFEEVERTAAMAQANTTGGFLDRGTAEYLIRNLARVTTPAGLADTAIRREGPVPIRIGDVAEVRIGKAPARGDAGMNGAPAVILAIQKQPGASTVDLTRRLEKDLSQLELSLPPDIHFHTLFRQATFIEAAIDNVVEALRDGAILVVIVLFLFLLNLRTTLITLTAIPLSLAITAIVMHFFGISVNTMTLGGLAVAIGEVVDDAIVDVENVLRRLKENATLPTPLPPLRVIFLASSEVRNSIVFATIIVVLVFVPLFALGGIEGRLFLPLGLAYVVSIVASLVVSLTVTPALASYLLPNAKVVRHGQDGALVRFLKRQDRRLLELALAHPDRVIGMAVVLVLAAVAALPFAGREFLPPFNEGTATISMVARPGLSLAESSRLGALAERALLTIPEIHSVGRRTGRAEQDEHAEGVHYSELDVELSAGPEARERSVVMAEMRSRLGQIPGVAFNIGQPISHRLDHLLSGVRAQLAIKVYGPELEVLRGEADRIATVLATVPGIVDLQIEQEVPIPQLRIELDRGAAARYGLPPGQWAEQLEAILAGKVVGEIVDGPRRFPITVRYQERERSDPERLARLPVELPDGQRVPLFALAQITDGSGPNQISHEHQTRRAVVFANVSGRDLVGAVEEAKAKLANTPLPTGYYLAFEGQFQSEAEATRLLAWLGVFSLLGMVGALWLHFQSMRLVLQVLINVPLALVGSVAAVFLQGGTLSVATVVGFITLSGIASRNSIMMLSHYLHLAEAEGEVFGKALIIRGSLERLVPVLMTALTAGLALVPLALAAGAPGKEILHPVAIVILGGLISSTLLDMVVTPAVFYRFGEKTLTTLAQKRGL
jgi:CzcA family heavy metal efflux pump